MEKKKTKNSDISEKPGNFRLFWKVGKPAGKEKLHWKTWCL